MIKNQIESHSKSDFSTRKKTTFNIIAAIIIITQKC